MSLNRRDFLRLAGLAAAATVVPSCAPVINELVGPSLDSAAAPAPLPASDFALLKRMTFGPSAETRNFVAEQGVAAWVEAQLAPDLLDDTSADAHLSRFPLLKLDADALILKKKADVMGALKQATFLRRLYSTRQLYEQMVHFWTDHFNISINKSECWALKVVDDREVIRRHALGNFREMLMASAHSPAMLLYLDNQANVKAAPNENYAREVMELHTLGVDGGYSQADVMTLARSLTGWTVKTHFWAGEFTFDEAQHDATPKTLLGRALTKKGVAEAEEALDRLAGSPATAHFIATKLVRRFVSDRPAADAPALVAKLADIFLATDGDIMSLMRVLFLDYLPAQTHLPPKFKRPIDFTTSALRQTNSHTGGHRAVYEVLGRLGQPDFEWPTPDGPTMLAEKWRHNLLPRWQFALALAMGTLKGTEMGWQGLLPSDGGIASDLDAISEILLGRAYPQNGRHSLLTALRQTPFDHPKQHQAIIAAGILASPAFQWR